MDIKKKVKELVYYIKGIRDLKKINRWKKELKRKSF